MRRAGWIVLGAAVVLLPTVTANTYYLYIVASAGLLTIVTAGLNVLVGFSGQMSLGHAGFYAIGAYTAAICTVKLGWNPWLAFLAAVLCAALVGAGVAGAALRVSGPYLAMVTIAFGIIVEGILVEWIPVTGGPGGIFRIPKPSLVWSYVLIMAVAALALWLTRNLRHSAWGRAFLAVRGSDVAAESLGLSAYYVRIVAFTVSAGFAGAGGALFAFMNGYISPDSFTLQTSILFLLALLFGGEGTVAGPAVGSLVLTLLPELLTSLTDYRLIIYGGLLMCSIYWLPAGVVGACRSRQSDSSDQPPEPNRPELESQPVRPEPATDRLMEVEGLSITFGGVAALSGVSLSLGRGIQAVIGPNGAGKTSLLNVLSGYYVAKAGHIRLDGESVTGRPPYAIARRGVARTFQTPQLFIDLTVLENVAVGVAGSRPGIILAAMLGLPMEVRRDCEILQTSRVLLDRAGLGPWAHARAESLPSGLRRRLEIVRALATAPRLLMLDEPAAGLSPTEIQELDADLSRLRATGPSVLLVEHHMDLVMAISDHITVLDYGRVIASGTPDAVRSDPAVIEAYLGASA
ncbi:MAG TPA: branched-chain amino acid ABC transporter ATP-binding protein/permease [Candidatus Baltobacteraceae bacterium]|nr:branched-chain amino acid ABC transporter ATP-binding protein/permease [Candidatus Baltobacteraceae bacterium]